MVRALAVLVLLTTALLRPLVAQAEQGRSESALEAPLRKLAAGAAERAAVDGAGLARSGRTLWSIEPLTANQASQPKVVIVGGIDGDRRGTEAVIRVLEWWFTDPKAALLRDRWQLAALPCAQPDYCDGGVAAELRGPQYPFPPAGSFFDGKEDPWPYYVWRWTTMQGPTVVVNVHAGGTAKWEVNALARTLVDRAEPAADATLSGALGAGARGAAWSAPVAAVELFVRAKDAPDAIEDLLRRAEGTISPLRTALAGRATRAAVDVARVLALRYPAQPIMSYIPALSWSAKLRLSRMTGVTLYHDKALAEMEPFLSGEKSAIAEPYLLTSLAGHLAFVDLAIADANSDADALARKAAEFILPEGPGEIVRFARGWTDDMFMAVSVLARVASRANDERYATLSAQLLTAYIDDLQRPDGLFIHAKEGPFAWGRGNGFAAFGLMEALTSLPAAWPARARVLQGYQALMKGMLARQAPDGMWRQVVDEPGSYREATATAMILTAMARGIRLGWIDNGYRPAVDRAWRGLLARIGEDGTVMDVCTGTGSGPTREYYLNRAGLTGGDDRGGAMALTAALEMEELRRAAGPR